MRTSGLVAELRPACACVLPTGVVDAFGVGEGDEEAPKGFRWMICFSLALSSSERGDDLGASSVLFFAAGFGDDCLLSLPDSLPIYA